MESYLRDYGEDLYCFCRSLSRSREEAEDLYQETFLKLYELADKLEIRTNPKGCLMTISVNLYRNYKRKMAIRNGSLGRPSLKQICLLQNRTRLIWCFKKKNTRSCCVRSTTLRTATGYRFSCTIWRTSRWMRLQRCSKFQKVL